MKLKKITALLVALALLLCSTIVPAAADTGTNTPFLTDSEGNVVGTKFRSEDWWDTTAESETENDGDGCSAAAPTVATDKTPSLSCEAAILINQSTGEVMYTLNGDKAWHPASTTKLMTAYLCAKYGNINDTYTVTSSAMRGLDSASVAGMYVGETYTVYQLLAAMLLPSGCDAANCIGEYIAGSTSAFVELMNKEAAALGCTGSHFANCHGVPETGHYVTVSDMAKIARAAMSYDIIRQVTGSYQITIEATKYQYARTFTNTNALLSSSGSAYSYPYCIGGKTGSSIASGYNAVFTAEKNGVKLLGVIYGADSGTSRWLQAAELLDWGFANTCANGHSYQTTLVPSSCTKAGCTVHTCSKCGNSYSDTPTAALGHCYQFTTTATCTEAGTSTHTCNNCGTSFSKETEALGHDYKITSTTADCTNPGTAEYTCSRCDDSYSKETEALGHKWSAWTPVELSTAEAAGTMTRSCARCEESETRAMPGVCAFTDVGREYYYIPTVWAVDEKITYGTTDTLFEPNSPCTRAQIVSFLYRAAGTPEPETTTCSFTDVDPLAYYYKAVLWASEKGITSGTTETTFSPDEPCTRAQIVSFLYRAAGYPKVSIAGGPFTDVPLNEYYYIPVLWASENGITSGTTETTFSPNLPCTRAQIVSFLFRWKAPF